MVDEENVNRSQNQIVPQFSGSIQGFNNIEDQFKMNADGSKTIIECHAIKRQDLNETEEMQMRIFYWAAYYGLNKYMKYMILHKRWSPFIKSFRNRSVVSGAIWGEQVETIRLLIGEYEYTNVS